MKVNGRTLFYFLGIILLVAIVRFFLKGWLEPLGISDKAGSFLVSITIAVFIGLFVFFIREGRSPEGSYWRGVLCFAVLAVWSQALIIAGIMLADKTGKATYYEEAFGQHLNMPPLQHAAAHMVGTVVEAIVGAILGAVIYFIARRGRKAVAPGAAQN